MTTHKDRAEKRAENNNPVNFTCGICKQVVPFAEGYKCINCDKEEVPEVV